MYDLAFPAAFVHMHERLFPRIEPMVKVQHSLAIVGPKEFAISY